jgi:SAM-dependent methyltransferase
MSEAQAWYDANAEAVVLRYEQVAPELVHGWLSSLLPSVPASILDVGAGSGRDAAWLSSKGYDVVAVEPSNAMRAAATRIRADAGVTWIADSLPSLGQVSRAGLSFDLILLSAVWMHVPISERRRAFRKLVNLLKPGGLLAISLRLGPAEPSRGMHPVSLSELEHLAHAHGAFIQDTSETHDELGRDEVRWCRVAIRLPDDGTGALPLLRHVILNDDKASTYKLALLRTLCRLADSAAGFARDCEDFVAVPLGSVALIWIRLFKPLLLAGLPQAPTNIGYQRLGFATEAFRALATVSHLDLRIGMSFSGATGASLHQALKDSAETIARMPATYMTYPNGGPIFPVKRVGRLSRPHRMTLDEAYLSSFGEMLVPRHLWTALRRFDAWIEPAIVAEWTRLMQFYAGRQSRRIDEAALAAALAWDEPSREVRTARERAIGLCNEGRLFCVWSGKRLSAISLDLDHCLPWSAWPCGDLWNLLPADRTVNQNQKRARLPGDRLLRASKDRITHWWDAAYVSGSAVLADRFWLEAGATLPTLRDSGNTLPDLFEAVCLQRTKLKHDQQVPEWTGEAYVQR